MVKDRAGNGIVAGMLKKGFIKGGCTELGSRPAWILILFIFINCSNKEKNIDGSICNRSTIYQFFWIRCLIGKIFFPVSPRLREADTRTMDIKSLQ